MIGNQTAETAVWHALMTKSQAISRIQLPQEVEAYLSRLVIRAMSPVTEGLFGENGQDPDSDELNAIGDECLVLAGLMPERAIREAIPVSYFVNVAFRAYSQLGEQSGDKLYQNLAEHLVDCIDVLHTLREIELGSSCIDPLNAFELWQETGSSHAWDYLLQLTDGFPVSEVSSLLN